MIITVGLAIFAILGYSLMYLMVQVSAHSEILKFLDSQDYPKTVKNYVKDNITKIEKTCALFWPIFLFYNIGFCLGDAIYDNLVGGDDEKGLAPWFFKKDKR